MADTLEVTKFLRDGSSPKAHPRPTFPPPAWPLPEEGVGVGLGAALEVVAAGFWLEECGVGEAANVDDDTADELGRGLQRPVLLRFFLARSWWWPRWRAWLGEKSNERALVGVGPNEHARITREERATRFKSFAAISWDREREAYKRV